MEWSHLISLEGHIITVVFNRSRGSAPVSQHWNQMLSAPALLICQLLGVVHIYAHLNVAIKRVGGMLGKTSSVKMIFPSNILSVPLYKMFVEDWCKGDLYRKQKQKTFTRCGPDRCPSLAKEILPLPTQFGFDGIVDRLARCERWSSGPTAGFSFWHYLGMKKGNIY